MGNCEVCSEPVLGHAPLTTERLADAVGDRDIAEIERLLDAGVGVNNPIDEDGHTVMDMLMSEHQELFMHATDAQQKAEMDAEKVTQMFHDQHEENMQIFNLLRKYGATLSDSG
eukprot:TRINITY_DN61691_c0_g1_i1.p1 TRINITY_DN61691_c0_g1~~TRINITY_DN61691_c0_g1_i1.p1  ORF type:complete len:133 (+),score=29.43 TRINITY_DN61691_c0_g1_i1:58-399(+)